MTPILQTPWDIAASAVLVLLDAGLSLALRLRLHRQLAVAAVRMVAQLLLGLALRLVLRWVFARADPGVTLAVVAAVAAREVAAHPEARLARGGNLVIGGLAVGSATALTDNCHAGAGAVGVDAGGAEAAGRN